MGDPSPVIDVPTSPLEAARALAPGIAARADEIERERRLPPEMVRSMAAAGLFRLCVPRVYGGLESEVAEMLGVIETISEADGSAGWCVMIGATSGLVCAYLPEDTAHEIYAGRPEVITGGVFAPKGQAVVENGGYRVTGRWPFASGCEHCTWLLGGCVVIDDGKPRLLARGLPDSRMMLLPAADVRIIDTWSVSGLRGTGSHDIEVAEVYVPAGRSASLITDRPRHAGALYGFPAFGLLALGISAVALGLARRAIGELVQVAGGKKPTGSQRLLAERPVIQTQVAEAEAALRAARAFLFEAVGEAWEAASAAGTISMKQRTSLRLAATHATLGATRAVDLMYEAGGGTSIYAQSPLQRCFRDVHVATHHMMVSPSTYELTGRLLLGLDTDTSML